MLGFLNFKFMNKEKRINTKNYKDNHAFQFVVEAAFAFGWTPCIGPVLGSIIALSATETTVSKGILLLSSYSLGLAIPFILSGYYMSKFLSSKKGFGKYYSRITKTGGTVLLKEVQKLIQAKLNLKTHNFQTLMEKLAQPLKK